MPRKKPSTPKGGNPVIEFTADDWKTIDNACKIHCTGEEIASLLNVSYDTFERRVKEAHGIRCADYIQQKAAGSKASLRRMQWNLAQGGNATMLIWLGKQYLKQSEKQEVTGADGSALQVQVVRFSDANNTNTK